MTASIHLAVEQVSGSSKFSLAWDGDLTPESLQINWQDAKVSKPSMRSIFEAYDRMVIEANDPVVKEAEKYQQRKIDGLSYSDLMNAKLNLFDISSKTDAEMDAIKDGIDTAFEKVQWFLEGGKWKSAQREVAGIEPHGPVTQDMIDEIKLKIDHYVAENY